MKRTYIIFTILIILLTPCFATPYMKGNLNIGYALDTSVFSNPLPSFEKGSCAWLTWKKDHPLMLRHSISTNASFDLFIHEIDRVGISTALNVKFPLKATSFRPMPKEGQSFTGEWAYEKEDCIKTQKTSVFWSLGPVFKASFTNVDLGVAVRLSLGGFDYIQDEVILGLQAEPYIDVFFTNSLFFNIKLTYDAHLLRFINDTTHIYEPYYQMLSVEPSIGVGIRF